MKNLNHMHSILMLQGQYEGGIKPVLTGIDVIGSHGPILTAAMRLGTSRMRKYD